VTIDSASADEIILPSDELILLKFVYDVGLCMCLISV